MTVGEVLMKRKRSNLRQLEVARRLGWNQETLVDIERGRLAVKDETIAQISAAIDQILEEKSKREGVMA